jgi:hypothetical protein
MLYDILYHGTRYGAWTHHEALKALRDFYPGGEIIPA